MQKILLPALFALGLGLAGVTGASAAGVGSGIASPVNHASPLVQVRWHRHCRWVRVCHGPWWDRHCHKRRVCYHRHYY